MESSRGFRSGLRARSAPGSTGNAAQLEERLALDRAFSASGAPDVPPQRKGLDRARPPPIGEPRHIVEREMDALEWISTAVSERKARHFQRRAECETRRAAKHEAKQRKLEQRAQVKDAKHAHRGAFVAERLASMHACRAQRHSERALHFATRASAAMPAPYAAVASDPAQAQVTQPLLSAGAQVQLVSIKYEMA